MTSSNTSNLIKVITSRIGFSTFPKTPSLPAFPISVSAQAKPHQVLLLTPPLRSLTPTSNLSAVPVCSTHKNISLF